MPFVSGDPFKVPAGFDVSNHVIAKLIEVLPPVQLSGIHTAVFQAVIAHLEIIAIGVFASLHPAPRSMSFCVHMSFYHRCWPSLCSRRCIAHRVQCLFVCTCLVCSTVACQKKQYLIVCLV